MIVDANLAIYWLVDTPLSAQADEILFRGPVLAPGLIRIETAAALSKYHRAGILTREQIRARMNKLDAIFSSYFDDGALLPVAMEIAIDSNHKIYDCVYLALAAQEKVPLVTADKRLAALAQTLSIDTELVKPK